MYQGDEEEKERGKVWKVSDISDSDVEKVICSGIPVNKMGNLKKMLSLIHIQILTVKSDDVVGRVKTYEAIIKGDNIPEPGIPESFKVLLKELQSLGLDVKVLRDDKMCIRDSFMLGS